MAPAIVNATLLVNNPQTSMIAIMEKNVNLWTTYKQHMVQSIQEWTKYNSWKTAFKKLKEYGLLTYGLSFTNFTRFILEYFNTYVVTYQQFWAYKIVRYQYIITSARLENSIIFHLIKLAVMNAWVAHKEAGGYEN